MYDDFKKACARESQIENDRRNGIPPDRIMSHNVGIIKNNYKKCQKCQKGTTYIYVECNINLHPECFIDYHNKYVYNKWVLFIFYI